MGSLCKVFGGRIPCGRILSHAGCNDAVETARQAGDEGRRARWRRHQVCCHLLLEGIPRKRLVSGECLVEHARQRIYVGPRVGMAGAEPLWGHVRPCTDGSASARQPHFACGPGYSEIDQVCEVLITDQDVRWFDVPVY
jgi:hypothetical protein